MPIGPVLAEAITATAVPRRGLFVGGGPNILPSVSLDSMEVEEVGTGGVSSMSFDIDDPSIGTTFQDGMDVRFWDIANNSPIFIGWVQQWSYVPAFGDQGRVIRVTCIGAEVLLDWIFVPGPIIFAANSLRSWEMIQSCLAQAVVPPQATLRAFTDTSIAASNGSQLCPLSTVHSGSNLPTVPLTVQNVTLREAIRQIYVATLSWIGGITAGYTVDGYFGLRTWRSRTGTILETGRHPADWTTLTVNDAPGGPIFAEGLSHEVDATGIVRGVYIIGGNAAGSGVVMDGSGKPGPIATVTDSTITDSVTRDLAGLGYLSSFAVGLRGGFGLIDHSPVFTVHAGGVLTMTDARTGNAATSYEIGSIRKHYNAVRETWDITYGGLAPSAMNSVRRLTRATLS